MNSTKKVRSDELKMPLSYPTRIAKTAVPPFMATGVGSLPFLDTKAALELIFETFPDCPHWPQLPKYKEEYFVNQFLQPLLDLDLLGFQEGKGWGFKDDDPGFIDGITRFYEMYLETEPGAFEDQGFLDETERPSPIGSSESDSETKETTDPLERFRMPHASARGLYAFADAFKKPSETQFQVPDNPVAIKGQVIGPVSAGFLLHDSEGKAAFYRNDLRDIVVKCLKRCAQWQTRYLKAISKNTPIVFVDEAFLSAYGSQMFISLDRQDIVDGLDEIIDGIESAGGIPGIHACTGGEWSILFDTKAQIVNTDVYDYFTSILGSLDSFERFLQEGKILAWGLIPTSDASISETAHTLLERFEGYIETLVKKGLNERRLMTQSIITPSCGTATLAPDTAKKVYNLAREVSLSLGKDASGRSHHL
jgi:hypothetical protein